MCVKNPMNSVKHFIKIFNIFVILFDKDNIQLCSIFQYLKKEDLHYPPYISANPWVQVTRSSLHIRGTFVYKILIVLL